MILFSSNFSLRENQKLAPFIRISSNVCTLATLFRARIIFNNYSSSNMQQNNTKQYCGEIEAHASFQEQVKNWATGCQRLGYIVESTEAVDNDEYFQLIQKNQQYHDWIETLLKSNSMKTFSSKEEWWHKEAKRKVDVNEDLSKIEKMFETIYNWKREGKITDEGKNKLIELILSSCCPKIGLLLDNKYNYYELSPNALRGLDAELLALLGNDPRFSIQIMHVLRVYSYRDYFGPNHDQEMTDEVVRFDIEEYNWKMNGAQKPKREEDLSIPFFQFSEGTVLQKLMLDGCSLTGGYYQAAIGESITFSAAMIISKTDLAMDCEKK